MKRWIIRVCPHCGEALEQEPPHHLHAPEDQPDRPVAVTAGLIEVIPLSEVQEALLAPDAIEAGAKARYERRRIPAGGAFTWDEQAEGIKQQWRSNLECDLKPLLDAAFSSTDSEGQG